LLISHPDGFIFLGFLFVRPGGRRMAVGAFYCALRHAPGALLTNNKYEIIKAQQFYVAL